MAKFLLFIDNYVNSNGNGSFNNVIYDDNINKVLSLYKNYRELGDNEIKKITDFVHNFYATDGENCNINELETIGIQVKILDDNEVCIPSTNPSFLFEVNKNNMAKEIFAVEKNIGGYSIDMYMEDLPFNKMKYRGHVYEHGTHIGYNMTEDSKRKTQEVVCINADKTFDTINTYQIFCL